MASCLREEGMDVTPRPLPQGWALRLSPAGGGGSGVSGGGSTLCTQDGFIWQVKGRML